MLHGTLIDAARRIDFCADDESVENAELRFAYKRALEGPPGLLAALEALAWLRRAQAEDARGAAEGTARSVVGGRRGAASGPAGVAS